MISEIKIGRKVIKKRIAGLGCGVAPFWSKDIVEAVRGNNLAPGRSQIHRSPRERTFAERVQRQTTEQGCTLVNERQVQPNASVHCADCL